MVWYSHLLKDFPQFVVIHTVKGFGIVNKEEVDVFLERSSFFDDPADVGNLISCSSAFSKSSLNIWKFKISKLKWTGMGEFNSDDHYNYYCGQESLRRNGVAIIVQKESKMEYLDAISKTTEWSLVLLQGKPFNVTVIQVYSPTSNAEEAEVERFYEDLQDLLELTPIKDVLFIIGDWNAKAGSQETPGVTGKFGLGVRNEARQRLIELCQENALVIANTFFQ